MDQAVDGLDARLRAAALCSNAQGGHTPGVKNHKETVAGGGADGRRPNAAAVRQPPGISAALMMHMTTVMIVSNMRWKYRRSGVAEQVQKRATTP